MLNTNALYDAASNYLVALGDYMATDWEGASEIYSENSTMMHYMCEMVGIDFDKLIPVVKSIQRHGVKTGDFVEFNINLDSLR